jgi:hypothetical protein
MKCDASQSPLCFRRQTCWPGRQEGSIDAPGRERALEFSYRWRVHVQTDGMLSRFGRSVLTFDRGLPLTAVYLH